MSDNQTVPEPEQDVEGHVQLHGPEGFPGGGPEGVMPHLRLDADVDGSAPQPEGAVKRDVIRGD